MDEVWDLIESVSEGFPTYSFLKFQLLFTWSINYIYTTLFLMINYYRSQESSLR